MEIQAIYKPGETHLQTIATAGICAYTDGKTVEKYMTELGTGFVCIPLEDALDQINQAEDNTYIKPWKEITEDEYYYQLEVLPPQKWRKVDDMNIFRMSEYMTGNITLHCANYNGKYYSACRRTSDNYATLAAEVKAV